MANLLEAKMLFLIHLGWEANETQVLHQSRSEPLKLLLLTAMGSRPGSDWLGARFGSAPNRC